MIFIKRDKDQYVIGDHDGGFKKRVGYISVHKFYGNWQNKTNYIYEEISKRINDLKTHNYMTITLKSIHNSTNEHEFIYIYMYIYIYIYIYIYKVEDWKATLNSFRDLVWWSHSRKNVSPLISLCGPIVVTEPSVLWLLVTILVVAIVFVTITLASSCLLCQILPCPRCVWKIHWVGLTQFSRIFPWRSGNITG